MHLPRKLVRQILDLIPEIIEHEDPRLPFTDRELTGELSKALGTELTENMVYRYRRSLGIPRSGIRKRTTNG